MGILNRVRTKSDLLLLAPFDIPDAFDDVAAQLPGAITARWPAAASTRLDDQEDVALPTAQELVHEHHPRLIVALESAAGVAISVARPSQTSKIALIDAEPYLPGQPVGTSYGFEAQLAALPNGDDLFDRLAEAEAAGASEEVRGQILVDHMSQQLLPTITDPHQRRMAAARIEIVRRDGLGSFGPPRDDRPVPAWFDAILEPKINQVTTVVLTSGEPVAADLADALAQHGIESVRRMPRPPAWWWADVEGAVNLLRQLQ